MQAKQENQEQRRMRLTKYIKDMIHTADSIQMASVYIQAQETFGADRLVVDRILAPYLERGDFEIVQDALRHDVIRVVKTKEEIEKEAEKIMAMAVKP